MRTAIISGILSLILTAAITWPAISDDISIKVVDESGTPLQGAVAYIIADEAISAVNDDNKEMKIIQQQGEAFIPFITLAKIGDTFRFRNRDPITHHVYSFSPAKPLNLVVESREESDQFILDTSGAIALGSSIHDHMTAFVYVTPSPLNGISDENGELVIKNVPSGQHQLFFWHYQIPKSETRSERIDTNNAQSFEIQAITKRAISTPSSSVRVRSGK